MDRRHPLFLCSCLCVFIAHEGHGPDVPESPLLHQEGVELPGLCLGLNSESAGQD